MSVIYDGDEEVGVPYEKKRAFVPQHVARMEHVTRPRDRLGGDAHTNPQFKATQNLEMPRQRNRPTEIYHTILFVRRTKSSVYDRYWR